MLFSPVVERSAPAFDASSERSSGAVPLLPFSDPIPSIEIVFNASGDEVLRNAYWSYHAGAPRIGGFLESKLELVRQYDVVGMTRAVTVIHGERDGSAPLTSILGGHPDAVVLPQSATARVFAFFDRFERLTVWEKLVAFPTYAAMPTVIVEYYSAVHALVATYGEHPLEWLESRRCFFQLLHVAQAAAMSRRPLTPRPLMILAQAERNDQLAAQFVADFPEGRFIHAICEPIRAIDSVFDQLQELHADACVRNPGAAPIYAYAALGSLRWGFGFGVCHRDLESRSRAVRLTDLESTPEAILRRVARWLELGGDWHLPAAESRGGPLLAGVPDRRHRRCKNLHALDRLVLCALLETDFRAWNYPCSRLLSRAWIRLCVLAACALLPMKMEYLDFRAVLRRPLPADAGASRVGTVCYAAFAFLRQRLELLRLIARAARTCLGGHRAVVKLV